MSESNEIARIILLKKKEKKKYLFLFSFRIKIIWLSTTARTKPTKHINFKIKNVWQKAKGGDVKYKI